MRQHLLDGDDVLPVGRELRDDVADPLVEREQAVREQLPDDCGNDRPPDRLQDVARLGARGAERLERDEPAVTRDGHLGRGQGARVDLQPHAPQEHVQPSRIDARFLRGQQLFRHRSHSEIVR